MEAVPNLLIGLREGLEAGLVVTILLAAVRQANAGASVSGGRRISPAPVWLGVLGAVMLAASFAAILTYSTDALPSRLQAAVGGLLSVFAVGLVTGMVFWMRRTARTLTAHLRGEVARAAAIGAGALTLTALLAIGREGLETTLFLWTAVRAAGSTLAPLAGAGLGLAAAVVLCLLLYRQAVRLNLGTFFNRTGLALVVIAAGVLAYGLGDLQEASLLPGQRWVAFDLTGHVDPNSWWVSIISGATELAPRMTVLQALAWVTYLAVVIPMFLRAGTTTERATTTPAPTPTSPSQEVPADAAAARPDAAGAVPAVGRWERMASARTTGVAAAVIVIPAAVAGLVIIALPSAGASATIAVTVTSSGCAPEWRSGHTGTQTFEVVNRSGKAGEINLTDASGRVVAEIETMGPATTVPMTATLGLGQYSFACLMSGATLHGTPVEVAGEHQATTPAVEPVTAADLTGPNRSYQAYAAQQLATLAHDVARLRTDAAAGDLAAAKRDWLAAQLDWERVGASYSSFGAAGEAVGGLPDGLPGGADDPDFTGLHRIEYGLYHGESAASLRGMIDRLTTDVATVRANLTGDDEAGDPTNLPLRAHEILEDAQRDHLSGLDDQGSGMAYALTYADTQATRTVLDVLTPLLTARMPNLVPTVTEQLGALQAALLVTRAGGQWQPVDQLPLPARQRVNGALGALLETLSNAPGLLDVPAQH